MIAVLNRQIVGAIAACLLVLGSCSRSEESTGGAAGADRFEVERLVDGLDGPTQLVVDDDRWLIAQLDGGEDAGQGQVLAIDPAKLGSAVDRPVVVVDELDKPTGLANAGGFLWVMERDQLRQFAVGSPLGDGVVVAALGASNGRSNGTITALDGRLLFNSSGGISDGVVDPGSGIIWSLSLRNAGQGFSQYASGFKHAYDRVELPDGTLLTTEISDGRLDGELAADALMVVEQGADHGWPGCVPRIGTTQRRVVDEFGGRCDDLPRIIATFDVGATPTSVETVPWDPSLVAVALWGTGEVVLITLGSGETVASIDFGRPQDLVADGDRLLVVDHERGAIYALNPASSTP